MRGNSCGVCIVTGTIRMDDQMQGRGLGFHNTDSIMQGESQATS